MEQTNINFLALVVSRFRDLGTLVQPGALSRCSGRHSRGMEMTRPTVFTAV